VLNGAECAARSGSGAADGTLGELRMDDQKWRFTGERTNYKIPPRTSSAIYLSPTLSVLLSRPHSQSTTHARPTHAPTVP
jgi:hypothetical protein